MKSVNQTVFEILKNTLPYSNNKMLIICKMFAISLDVVNFKERIVGHFLCFDLLKSVMKNNFILTKIISKIFEKFTRKGKCFLF